MASEKVLAFVENVKELTVLELAELVKALEEEFGVSAAAPVAVAAAPAKALVDECPKPIKEGASKAEAEEIKAKLEEAGAEIELK